MSTGSDLVLVEGATGPVATVAVNRPQALNALDAPTLAALVAAFEALAASEVHCVILTGAGEKAFVAGADIKAMAAMTPAEAGAFAGLAHRLGAILDAMAAPVIAAVNGFALGGGLELALLCDFIYAAKTAKLGQPEVGLGVVPGLGGTQRLPRRVGVARARELLYTGAVIDAAEALRIGLVNAVLEPTELMPRVRAVADAIAARAPLAVAAAKRATRVGADVPLEAGLALERELFSGLFATDDQKEGMRAFIEKRAAKWTGR
ncbi:MAG TPA: enoyl-CoA hydratase-related protein [Polyangia bacterium]|nr:enoyl-CoA hydratase-related protein [Polyangia bacterium]